MVEILLLSVCEHCGKTLEKYQQRFCSRQCAGKKMCGERAAHWQGGERTLVCKECGAQFQAYKRRKTRKFCSHECYSAFRSHYYRGDRVGTWKGGNREFQCETCGDVFMDGPGKQRRFCSSACFHQWLGEYLSKEGSPLWRGGTKPYPKGWNRRLRELIRKRDRHCCALCGKTEAKNGKKLEVHHIDYTKDNIELSNLISLCHKCHLMTGYNRNWWREVLSVYV